MPVITLTFLINMYNKPEKILRKKKENNLETQMKIQSLKKNWKIQPGFDHNFPSPTMKLGLMSVHQNDPEKFIDNPEYFRQYHS